ncbi:hypothetical protein L6452_02121 [Arctium lappa]|uniref:Uncharacterized protein n=1 Tax=Arctium lappa TaxID=4217 RepID=A0ACB9FJK5_ARCLA|nr:hypothetical protein L6452_02121 [Arctium lappa]
MILVRQCEQCSKSLLEQRMRLKNKLQKPVRYDSKGVSDQLKSETYRDGERDHKTAEANVKKSHDAEENACAEVAAEEKQKAFASEIEYLCTIRCSASVEDNLKIMKMDAAEPFNVPVNPVVLGIPDYFDVIKTPMDFGTICSNLESGLKYMNSKGADPVQQPLGAGVKGLKESTP